jgi:hypothetical protein
MVTIDLDAAPLEPEELKRLLQAKPLSGAEIVKAGLVGGWSDEGIADGQAWVDSQRQTRRENRAG